ncbi:MAG: hypothetical protein ACRCUS_10560, partial [Anaerovoracaceae bacterium]
SVLAGFACVGIGAAAEAKIPILRGKLVAELAKTAGQNSDAALRGFLNSAARTVAVNSLILGLLILGNGYNPIVGQE